MGKKNILNALLKIINFITPKIKQSIYINLGLSSKNNFEDLINNSGSNILRFINGMLCHDFKKPLTVYIEFFDASRKELYDQETKKALNNNIRLFFIRGCSDKKGFEKFKGLVIKYHTLFRCKIWAVVTGDYYLFGKLKSQSIVNFNYFISCKNDLVPNDYYRWSFLDCMLTTSRLASTVVSAQTGVKLDHCIELGFPRNDTLFDKSKKSVIFNWINEEIGYFPKKIIVYAPTYRDYEKMAKDKASRELFGFKVSELEDYLRMNQFCLICKLHNLTSKSIVNIPKGVIPFKLTYDYSFYDLLAVTDCLITDYSSVGYDYLLLNRPIIYNLFDLEKYTEDRGLSYYPYEEFCPGRIIKNELEMMMALNDFASNIDRDENKRLRLLRVFHKYSDANSTDRVIQYFCNKYDFEYADDKKTY